MMAQWTNSIHGNSWVGEFSTSLFHSLPHMQGPRYGNNSLCAMEYFVIGSHEGERVTVQEGIPVFGYEPVMDSYRDFVRNTLSWIKVMGDVVFTTRDGTRTVQFSTLLNGILNSLSKIEGARIHAPLVEGGRYLMVYVQEPIASTGNSQSFQQYRHWQILLPVCRIGEFTWTT